MEIFKIADISQGVTPLSDCLIENLLMHSRVLWLVPGGSNIPLSVAVMDTISDELSVKLTIMLTDERYGDVGHGDSNTVQLELAGFKPKQATVIPVLQPGLDLAATTRQYAANFQTYSQQADIIIGQFGLGADSHIAGMLPGSPAVTSAELTAGYATDNFTRITLTPNALKQVNIAYVFAFGQNKLAALQKLRSSDAPLDEQPVQILKQIAEACVYNDQIGTYLDIDMRATNT